MQAICGPIEPNWHDPENKYFIPVNSFPTNMILNVNPVRYSKKFKKKCTKKECRLRFEKIKKYLSAYKNTLKRYKMIINRLQNRKSIAKKEIIRKKK